MAKAAKLAVAPANATIPDSPRYAAPPGPFRRLGLYGLEAIAPVLLAALATEEPLLLIGALENCD